MFKASDSEMGLERQESVIFMCKEVLAAFLEMLKEYMSKVL